MFVGHFGVGLAAKRAAPRLSLGTLFLAVQWADLLWPVLLLLGLEHVRIVPGLMRTSALDFTDYPISHSLVSLVGWGLLFAGAYGMRRRDPRGAAVLGLCVVSHWPLDVLMHRPDMPLAPGVGVRLGLGLWNSVPATLLVEGAMYTIGILLYLRATRAADRVGTWSFAVLVALLAALWLAALFGPPPPDEKTLGYSGLAGWLLLPWAYWIDRHRQERAT
ncbi:MAG TPA: hypothetical protein VIY96_12550 [Thermoanaerobaculia bacterium]